MQSQYVLRSIGAVLSATLFLPSAAPTIAKDLGLSEVVLMTASYLSNLTAPNLGVSPPKFRVALRGERIPAGCLSRTGDTTVYGSHYCPANRTVVLELIQMENIRRRYGSGGVAFVIAHEYAHYMQDAAGIELANPFQELHADCMAGSLLLSGDGHAIHHLNINQSDITAMVRTAFSVGGGDVHGTSEQRLSAFFYGATNSLLDCDSYAGLRQTGKSNPATSFVDLPGKDKASPFVWIKKSYYEGRLIGEADMRPAWPVYLGADANDQMTLKYYNVAVRESQPGLSGAKYVIEMILDISGRTIKADYSCMDRKYALHPSSVTFSSGLAKAKPAPQQMVVAFNGICDYLAQA